MTKEQSPSNVDKEPITNNITIETPEDVGPEKISAVAAQYFIDYESGLMSDEETITFFQRLINNGMAWGLQGHYGRMASHLIKNGVCHEALPRDD
jgi:hypothetical protein